MAFKNCSWIWYSAEERNDDYAEFFDSFEYFGGKAVARISADSDYILTIGGKYASSSQYGDFEHYKIYDEVDITPFLSIGDNEISLIAHHYGIDTSRHRAQRAGAIYEIEIDGKVALASRAGVPSRRARGYASERGRIITGQLGLGFAYDATDKGDAFSPAIAVDKKCVFYPRPIEKGRLDAPTPMRVIKREGNRILVDLGEEFVGYPTLDIDAEDTTDIKVSWGEHIVDGWVRRLIGRRDFSFDYRARGGKNLFSSRMLRIAARYMEISSSAPIKLNYLGIIPEIYGEDELPVTVDGERERDIYRISMRTLRLSMMEHYVDSPWREQSLYAFDSRNQMLFGYYSLKNKNKDYARACLRLLGEDRRDDGLLSITAPCGMGLAIPSFSLYYVIEMKEYIEHTADTSLSKLLYKKMISILEEFKPQGDGLVYTFPGKLMWNFYDWSDYSVGTLDHGEEPHPDLCLNALTVMALDAFRKICGFIGEKYPFGDRADRIRRSIRDSFRTESGIYTMIPGEEKLTVLGNSLAILADVANGDSSLIAEAITAGKLCDCSLSMKIFEYDALLKVNEAKYRDFCLDEVKENYGRMLDFGSTTVWETIKGEADFDKAGSLCHGWSAIPVYLYHRLGIAKTV